MNRFKKILGFLLRMDNLNRILVFISLSFIVVLPSWILYLTDPATAEFNIIIPCLLVLGATLGTGAFTLHRPIRISWFYFLEAELVYIICADTFLNVDIGDISSNYSTTGMFITQMIFNGLGFILNLIFFLQSLYRYRRSRSAFNEGTNNDSPLDFLNGRDINNDVEKSLMKIVPNSDEGNLVKRIKGVKFSRAARGICFAETVVLLIAVLVRGGRVAFPYSFPPAFIGIVLLPILFLCSLFLPGDFKYLFYYNVIVIHVLLILASSHDGLPIFWLITSLIITFLCLLSTLITEGRTWTGTTPDQK